jgi:imidazoleglycerol-phosphate dehydratase
MAGRSASHTRKTSETSVSVTVGLDGSGRSKIETPIGFLSHMVEQLSKHGLFDLDVTVKGDTHIDGHHTTEDLAVSLGRAFKDALGEKKGIRRYGSATLPMDEACVTCAVDLSGRPFLVWKVPLPKSRIGDFDTELAEVFFEGFARGAEANVHVHLLSGQNLHHIVEISFKALAKALRQATEIDPRAPGAVASTKGTLTE